MPHWTLAVKHAMGFDSNALKHANQIVSKGIMFVEISIVGHRDNPLLPAAVRGAYRQGIGVSTASTILQYDVSLFLLMFRSINSEEVGLFLGNGSTRTELVVPYSRVVASPGDVSESITMIDADMVRGYGVLQ